MLTAGLSTQNVHLSVTIEYGAVEPVRVRKSLRTSTFTDTDNSMLFWVQDPTLQKTNLKHQKQKIHGLSKDEHNSPIRYWSALMSYLLRDLHDGLEAARGTVAIFRSVWHSSIFALCCPLALL